MPIQEEIARYFEEKANFNQLIIVNEGIEKIILLIFIASILTILISYFQAHMVKNGC